MLESFKLKYGDTEILAQRGRAQGSTLSLILINIFLNDLLNLLESNGIYILAFADNLVWCWNSLDQVYKLIKIVKDSVKPIKWS